MRKIQIVNTPNLEKAKKEIKNLQRENKKTIIVQAQNDNFNRKILEYGKFNILLGIECGNRKNTPRQIDSGFNHILAKIAKKNDVAIGIDLNSLQKLNKTQKAIQLARIKQNIDVCKKTKTKTAVVTKKENKKQAAHLLLSLGASTTQAKQAISF